MTDLLAIIAIGLLLKIVNGAMYGLNGFTVTLKNRGVLYDEVITLVRIAYNGNLRSVIDNNFIVLLDNS